MILNIKIKDRILHFRNFSTTYNKYFKKELDEYTFINFKQLCKAKMALFTIISNFTFQYF